MLPLDLTQSFHNHIFAALDKKYLNTKKLDRCAGAIFQCHVTLKVLNQNKLVFLKMLFYLVRVCFYHSSLDKVRAKVEGKKDLEGVAAK